MSFQDKTVVCFDCSQPFTFSVAEQEQSRARGHATAPKRCPKCRQAWKEQRTDNRSDNFGNSLLGSLSVRSGGYGAGSPRQMFPAVCSDCGKPTKVPFEPRRGKPVRCNDCYRKVQARR
jgi:CxxC-x17-CxxC domain-containing protein